MSFRGNINDLNIIINSSNGEVERLERERLTVDGELLNSRTAIARELTKVSHFLAHEALTFSEKKYEDFMVLNAYLNDLFYQRFEKRYDVNSKLLEVYKRVIVFMQLELGMSISFLTTFVEMKRTHMLDFSYKKLSDMGLFRPDHLFEIFDDEVKEFIYNKDEVILEYNYMEKYDNNYNADRILSDYKVYMKVFTNINKAIKKLEETEIEKYQVFSSIVKDIKDRYLKRPYNFMKDKGLMVEKLISYFQLQLNMPVTFGEVIDSMINSEELAFDTDLLIEMDALNLDYLEARFSDGKKYLK